MEKQASDKQMNNTENSTHVTTVGVGKNKVAIEIIGCVIHCCCLYYADSHLAATGAYLFSCFCKEAEQ